MSFCPFISTPDKKLSPSHYNCSNCCFYVGEFSTSSTYCAILLSAERTSNIVEILTKKNNLQ